MKKNILYISYHYPPSNSIGANRSFSQVFALRALGHRVKVIYASQDNSRFITNKFHTSHEDDISIEINYGTIEKLYYQSSYIKYLLIKYAPFITIFAYHLKLFFFDEQKDWNTGKNFELVVNALDGFDPDLLISTSGPIENHSFASKFKKLYSCFWVAEYRDSWSYNPMMPGTNQRDLSSKICRIKERKIISKADLVLAVSLLIKDYYENFFNKRSYLIYSGWLDSSNTLPEPQHVLRQSNKKNILHLGSLLLGKRSPIPIIDIFEKNARIRKSYNMHFIGRDTHLFQDYLKNTSHAKNSFFLENEVSFLQARAEGMNADILLLLMMDHSGEQHVVTGKIYEYIYLQKPIIIIDSQNSEASKIIQKYKLGYICKSINEFEDLLISLENENDLLLPSSQTISQFNVLNTMNDFMHYLDQSFSQKF